MVFVDDLRLEERDRLAVKRFGDVDVVENPVGKEGLEIDRLFARVSVNGDVRPLETNNASKAGSIKVEIELAVAAKSFLTAAFVDKRFEWHKLGDECALRRGQLASDPKAIVRFGKAFHLSN
jgi:hypothetical protein